MKLFVRIYKSIFEFSKQYLLFSAAQIILKTVQPFIMILFMGYLVNAVTSGQDLRLTLGGCLGFLLCDLMVKIVCAKVDEMVHVKGNHMNLHFEEKLGSRIMQMDYEYLEDSNILDNRDRAVEGIRENGGTNISAVNDCIVTMISSLFVMAGTVYIIYQLNIWILALLVVVVAMSLLSEKLIADYEVDSWRRWIPLNRRFRMVYQLMYDFFNAKDIRLYDAADFFSGKVRDYNRDSCQVLGEEAAVTARYTLLSNLFGAIQLVAVYGTAAYYVFYGIISLGDFTVYVSAVNQFVGSMTDIARSVIDMRKNIRYINEYFEFLELPDRKVRKTGVIRPGSHCLELRHVSFGYGEKEVLKDISIRFCTGEKIGIVGENGAGKTTFIKLLLRLYDPTQGTILMDGKDIREYDPEAYAKLFGVAFQDFSIYPFSLRENITCSGVQEQSQRLGQVIRDMGLEKVAAGLPDGVDTLLSKTFEDGGVDLSGGEKQKIAIARALYRDSSVLILDEPTASLDAKAEAEIYRQFRTVSKGKLSLFISHRLASCMFCDKVMVIEDGRIIQYGSHEELMAEKDGKYAKMFEVQAKRFGLIKSEGNVRECE